MLIAAVVIASCIAVSSAQVPSPECSEAYNATFRSQNSTNCSLAYFSLLSPVTSTDEKRMMVCDEGQMCNIMLENVITTCGDSVSYLNVGMCS